jgi:hypothetical protein
MISISTVVGDILAIIVCGLIFGPLHCSSAPCQFAGQL